MNLTFDGGFIRVSLLIVANLLLLACQLTANTEPQPARLTLLKQASLKEASTTPHIGQSTLDEIRAVVRQSLNGAKITLAKQFLVNSSGLIIEPSHKQTLDNSQPLGRSYELPIKFQLLKNDGKCFIRKSGTEKLWPLKKAKCHVQNNRKEGIGTLSLEKSVGSRKPAQPS